MGRGTFTSPLPRRVRRRRAAALLAGWPRPGARPGTSRTGSGPERQFLTSMTNTPPGPTNSMSTLAARVPGHLRSTSKRHPRAVRTNIWAATLRSPSPAASQRRACCRATCHCSLSNRSCRRASCARRDADPPAVMPRSLVRRVVILRRTAIGSGGCTTDRGHPYRMSSAMPTVVEHVPLKLAHRR